MFVSENYLTRSPGSQLTELINEKFLQIAILQKSEK
jgi:hypothetical protein